MAKKNKRRSLQMSGASIDAPGHVGASKMVAENAMALTLENGCGEENAGVEAAWFVLYVRSGSEEKILRTLKLSIDTERFVPFIPKKVLPFCAKSVKKLGKKGNDLYCFPGYIFFQVHKVGSNISDFYSKIVRAAVNIDETFYFLYYGDDKKDIELHSNEQRLLTLLMDANFRIDMSIGLKEGDDVRVVFGPLKGLEGYIKKVDWHRRIATLNVSFMGDKREMTLGIDYVGKSNNSTADKT